MGLRGDSGDLGAVEVGFDVVPDCGGRMGVEDVGLREVATADGLVELPVPIVTINWSPLFRPSDEIGNSGTI